MYTMKDVCSQLDISYETLKFYCKEGLVPNVQRDKNNYRLFNDHHVAWVNGLLCLRKCGMSIKDMKIYMNYCLEGESTIPIRKEMLSSLKNELVKKEQEIRESMDYIDNKQDFYDDVLNGKMEYKSNIIELK